MTPTETGTSPVAAVRGVVGRLWRDLLSVYYANTPVWRWLKSGALVVFGFFCWTGSSVLLSYRSDWGILTYAMAYGFLLIAWGPLTHFLVVPAVIRLRRSADGSLTRTIARHGSKLNLSVFLTLVLVLGTLTPGVMMFEYTSPLGEESGTAASAEVTCETGEEVIACQLENVRGTDHVVVTSGGEPIARADEPPYDFEFRRQELVEGSTGRQFVVELRDAEGDTQRRYVRIAGE